MPAKFTAEAGAARRAEIMDAAGRVFAEKGYERTTVRDLEAATGLTRGGIFFHFAGKRDLYRAVLRRCALEHAPTVRQAALSATTAEEGLLAAYHAIVTWNRAYPETMPLFRQMALHRERDPDLAEIDDQTNEAVTDVMVTTVREFQERGIFGEHFAPEIACTLVHAVLDSLVEIASNRPEEVAEATAQQVLSLVAIGLKPQAARPTAPAGDLAPAAAGDDRSARPA